LQTFTCDGQTATAAATATCVNTFEGSLISEIDGRKERRRKVHVKIDTGENREREREIVEILMALICL